MFLNLFQEIIAICSISKEHFHQDHSHHDSHEGTNCELASQAMRQDCKVTQSVHERLKNIHETAASLFSAQWDSPEISQSLYWDYASVPVSQEVQALRMNN